MRLTMGSSADFESTATRAELRRDMKAFRMTKRKDRTWVETLRDAAHIGIADVKAGRIQTLGSREQLDQHFSAIAEDAIASVHEQRRVEE
ncbi:hypothetical protein [Paraburkholderia fungorum]|uniref:hypothetical protein n=1 Tax=Paraburkholderia fungorum TaxID=134537 RepID=UPI001C1F01F0|nr:hypothetical protein [Paraburkholderia fungorum]MBU7440249.1 hypothetical protein [Paraburkholderia fungorum]